MTKIAILIASHINYKNQLELLDNCLKSLIEQTLKPNTIYVSISFDSEIYIMDFKNILQKYGRMTSPKICFKISKEQKYQMEHLHNIYASVDLNNYDMLMFCDDDDTYHSARVHEFASALNTGKDMHVGNFGGVREIMSGKIQKIDLIKEIPEYWCYGIIPIVLSDFFSFFHGINYTFLQHKFADEYFRHYLRRNSKYKEWIGISIKPQYGFNLYNYNKNNPHSICGKLERGESQDPYEDNLLTWIKECRTESDFNDIIQKNKKIYNIDKKLRNTMKMMYDFCQTLYK